MARQSKRPTFARTTFALALLLTHACSSPSSPIDDRDDGKDETDNQDDYDYDDGTPPFPGDSFVSAEEASLWGRSIPESWPPAPTEIPRPTLGRNAEEGDLYRALEDGTLLYLSPYRGLQLIDITDMAGPTIKGHLPIIGEPAEMYVVGEQAMLLLNRTWSYHAQPGDTKAERRSNNGVIMLVDISDRTSPRLLDEVHVPGIIERGYLASRNGFTALYVAANEYGSYIDDAGVSTKDWYTVLRSFVLSGSELVDSTELVLLSKMNAMEATPEVLLVSVYNATRGPGPIGSRVHIIDIADPRGTMRRQGSVITRTIIRSPFQMDYRDGILRIFSDSEYSGAPVYLQTWNVTNPSQILIRDEIEFGARPELAYPVQLLGAVFADDKAFAVTTGGNPLYAFSIGPNGEIAEDELAISGRIEFLQPVIDNTRLIAIENTEGPYLRVSLYDITDLDNPALLITGAESAGPQAIEPFSRHDYHRASTVLENAVSVTAPTGELETGLMLVPFNQAIEPDSDAYIAGVQIFTFSATTVTRREFLEHGHPVARALTHGESIAANFSDIALSTFDYTSPNAPTDRGRIEFAPNYTGLLSYGEYRARLKNAIETESKGIVEIIASEGDPQAAVPVASFEVPKDAAIFKGGPAGELLIAVERQTGTAQIALIDLSDPTAPQPLGTAEIPQSDQFPRSGSENLLPSHVIGDALVLPSIEVDRERTEAVVVCATSPVRAVVCNDEEACMFVTGTRECHQPEIGSRYCFSRFAACVAEIGEEPVCTLVARDEIQVPLDEMCVGNASRLHYDARQLSVKVVDIANRDSPELHEIRLPAGDAGVSVRASGQKLYAVTKRSAASATDPRPYARYYATPIDVSDPSNPVVGPEIYLPGELLAVHGDDLYTRHNVWKAGELEASIVHLRLEGNEAVWMDAYPFPGQYIENAVVDESGNVVVSHYSVWRLYSRSSRFPKKLTILSTDGSSLEAQSEVEITDDAFLRSAAGGRALFQVDSGLLVMSMLDVARPVLQALLPMAGFPQNPPIEDAVGEGGGGNDLLVPAGHYGIYRLSPDTFSFLPPTN